MASIAACERLLAWGADAGDRPLTNIFQASKAGLVSPIVRFQRPTLSQSIIMGRPLIARLLEHVPGLFVCVAKGSITKFVIDPLVSPS